MRFAASICVNASDGLRLGSASAGKTLDWDAGCSTLVFAVHTAALAAQLLQPQRGNLSGAFSYLAGFLGELSARSQRFAAICGGRRRRRSPSITAPTGTRPLHRGGRATHPRAPIWVHPSCSRMPPFCYSTSQEPEEAGASPPTASLRRQPPRRTRRIASGADEGPSIICSNVGDGADQSQEACSLP